MLAGVLDDAASGSTPDRPDMLVLMGGSNDIDAGVPIATILRNQSGIPKVMGAERVPLSAVPPEAAVQDTVDELNAQLPALTAREVWQFSDPLVDVRTADGRWLPGDGGRGPAANTREPAR